jgi:ribosomal-protein-alanine N-acetyltransferase
VLDEGEILNLTVVRANRRHGEGTALSREMLKSFAARGVQRVFLEARESNLAGIAFYKKLGFGQVGRREGYYREPAEAALILEHSTNNPQLGTE